MDHGSENGYHVLFVYYHDSSFSYTCGYDEDPVWVDADREAVEAALDKYPVLLPEYADFIPEGEGWYSFTVDQYIDGATMIDGTLRCRYAADGMIREIENNLLTYTYYDTEKIISPEEAYKRLCSGKFYDSGSFERRMPDAVSVFSCRLGYTIDTKGFYQPVYWFDVASPDGNYQECIMIPAME